MRGIARSFESCSIDVGLMGQVDLFHHDRRSPSCSERALQSRQARLVLTSVVVDFAEQDHGVAAQPMLPGAKWDRRARDKQGCQH